MKKKSHLNEAEVIKSGRRVLNHEAAALTALALALGDDFVKAVECLNASDGRIAVTGMGKSGHVAKKVAATFASTGTPSYFIHPAEASHGDLGMLSAKDVVLAYSNSGETLELDNILGFCARYGIPVIGVTKNPKSFLGRESSICLELPDLPEACPIGCAPTTSTTMMMALGDALALGLLEAKGFTAEDFHKYHPGGQLGRKLLAVREIMHKGKSMPLADPDQPMSEVLYTMSGKGFGCVGVTDKAGLLIGVITDGDLRRHMGPGLLRQSAGDIMTKAPVTIPPETLAIKALGLMQSRSITNIFVAREDRRPVGILHIHDCLRAGLE